MPNWYAIYTRSRQEKKVKQLLDENGIKTFLPLNKVLKLWSDRKKWVECPLFNSYIFVKIENTQFETIRFIPGFVRFVSFSGVPAIIREQEIELINNIVSDYNNIDIGEYNFNSGEKVLITGGLLNGTQAICINQKGKNRVAVRINDLHTDLIIDVPANFLQNLSS